jgi:hypothetical protein
MDLKAPHIETMQKCVEKLREVIAVLKSCGVKVHTISKIDVLDTAFGTATLEIDFDFRGELEE